MIIGIDYDNTWSSDPALFGWVADLLKKNGHTVVVVSNRREGDTIPALPSLYDIPLYYAGPQYKEDYMNSIGIPVDIWIDDSPGTVQRGKYLDSPPEEEL